MKQRISCALIALAASVALPVLAAKPPPPAPAPAPAPAAAAAAPAESLTICYHSGDEFAICAASWELVSSNGNKVDSMKLAWEASGFENFVASLRYENEDSSWCEPASGPTSNEDAYKVVVKYLKDNPDRVKSTAAAVLVDKALHEAYPCTKKGH